MHLVELALSKALALANFFPKIIDMLKVIKKVVLGCLSILGISTIVWIVLLLNPSLSYANSTTIDQVTVYHNEDLQLGTESIVKNALAIIKTADIYDKDFQIHLCLNDDKIYPDLHPTPGGTAYSFLNKSVIYASTPDFDKNISEFRWEANNNELRSYNLTHLIAHEFMHNLQHNSDPKYFIQNSIGKIYWKFEGHAEYISRRFKNDGRLLDKIEKYLEEEKKEHIGYPVFLRADGTIQILSYFKYANVVQYLFEIKKLSYQDICDLEPSIEKPYAEMIAWYNNHKG